MESRAGMIKDLNADLERCERSAKEYVNRAEALKRRKKALESITDKEMRDVLNWYEVQLEKYTHRMNELSNTMMLNLFHCGMLPRDESLMLLVGLYQEYEAVASIYSFLLQ